VRATIEFEGVGGGGGGIALGKNNLNNKNNIFFKGGGACPPPSSYNSGTSLGSIYPTILHIGLIGYGAPFTVLYTLVSKSIEPSNNWPCRDINFPK